MISNCGHDENNRYSGGKAGDQTGTEWRVINWYNRPWKCVLRHPNAKVRKMIASMAKAAAVNNKIGYDQSERYTFGSISRHRITTLHKSRLRVRQIVHPVSLQS